MEKIIKIENQEIGLKVTAATVLKYREQYGRDLLNDIANIEKELFTDKKLDTENSARIEDIIYIMAKDYNGGIMDTKEKWLEQFSPFFSLTAFVFVLEMWHENLKTLNESKKN